MDPKPRIFISAVSKELRSARQLVANTLTFLGFEPVWQDVFGAQSGDLRDMLRNKIAPCQGLVQLAGQRFGFGPTDPATDPAAISYTQFELLHARELGKKIWPILLGDDFPADELNEESEACRENQRRYRRRLQEGGDLFQMATDLATVETFILKLRQPLEELRAEWEKERRAAARFRVVVSVAIVLVLGVLGWLVFRVNDTRALVEKQNEDQRAMKEQLLAAIRQLPQSLSETKKATDTETDELRLQRAYATVELRLKLPAGTLAKELPIFAQQLLQGKDTADMDRASAHFATGRFADAKAAALQAKDRAVAGGRPMPEVVSALVLAGQAAEAQTQYEEAATHYGAAAALTSREHDILAWANVQNRLGWLLYLRGKYPEAEQLMGVAWKACLGSGKEEDPIALSTHHRWASALLASGQAAKAEEEFRTLLPVRKRVLGPEHPDTLSSWNNFATALDMQGKYAEAETEHRARIAIEQRALGPEHADTSRSRMNLAAVLHAQKKFPDAEAEYRAALQIQEHALGGEHPDTLETVYNLALCLWDQHKYADAKPLAQRAADTARKILGPDHPESKRYQVLATRLQAAL